eukprot:scaffold37161_cov153-Amphora_coffeaeformis.AAC.1
MAQQDEETPPPPKNQDFVIRDGFPALRNPDGTHWVEGDEPLPQAPVRIFPQALTVAADGWSTLYQDCRTVFSARTRDDDQAYSAGVTYFLPAVMKPRCALEAVVQAIFQAHTACLPPGSMLEEQSGAEWWTLVLDDDDKEKNKQEKEAKSSIATAAANEDGDDEDEEEESDEVGLHFDADYGLEGQVTNLFLHPRVGTVTYLTDCGAPTVVLDRPSPQQGNMEALNGDIAKGWLCHPTRGRHLAFDGRLLHGAPATFFPAHVTSTPTASRPVTAIANADSKPPPTKKAKLDDDTNTASSGAEQSVNQRITLLVNVWVNHCPMDAEPMEDEICSQLKTPMDALQFEQKLPARMAPEATVKLTLSADDPAGEEEVVIGNRIVTAHYGPTMDDLHAATASASTVALEFDKGALCLVVGGLAPQDEDESGDDDN